MEPEQQDFQANVVNNVENIPSSPTSGRVFASELQSDLRLVPQVRRIYPSMLDNTSRHPDSSQRTHHQHGRNPIHDYPSPYASDIGAGVHLNDSHPSHNPTQATQRYSSASEATPYPSTSLSVNIPSLPIDHRLQSTSPLEDYRHSLRGYHQLQSHGLQQQQLLHDSPDRLPTSLPLYPQADAFGYASDAPDPFQHSHPQMHAQQHRLATSSSRDSLNSNSSVSSNNNPSYTSDARSVGTAHSSGPYHTLLASSSIPMSNTEPLHLQPDSFHAHHDLKSIQATLRERFRRNVDPLTSTTATAQPSISVHQHPSSHPRSRSTPDPFTHHVLHSPSSTHSVPVRTRHRHSPLSISDTESAVGSESTSNEEAARDDNLGSSLKLRRPGQADEQALISLGRRNEKKRDGTPEGSAGEGAPSSRDRAEVDSLVPAKKNKKSKMHECQICKKKFPRPSGLRTHMNTHNNERPFACTFPGCTRTFAVRSNAKRHLRTHGVIPTPSHGSNETPYVVDFSTPMILPPHPHSIAGAEGSADFHQAGAENQDRAGFDSGQARSHEQHTSSSSRTPAFKVRWMPLSLTARTNAALLRQVQDQQSSQAPGGTWSDVSRKGKEAWTGEEMDEDDEDDDQGNQDDGPRGKAWMETDDEGRHHAHRRGGMFDDGAAASRSTVPLQPVQSSSDPSSSSVGTSSGSGSRSGLSLTAPSSASHQSSAYSSISPPSSTSEFTPLSSTGQSDGYSSRDSFQGIDPGTTAGYEERNPYLQGRSHHSQWFERARRLEDRTQN